jgi:hypothetical protein
VEAAEGGGPLGGGFGGVLFGQRLLAVGIGQRAFGANALLFSLGAGERGD